MVSQRVKCTIKKAGRDIWKDTLPFLETCLLIFTGLSALVLSVFICIVSDEVFNLIYMYTVEICFCFCIVIFGLTIFSFVCYLRKRLISAWEWCGPEKNGEDTK